MPLPNFDDEGDLPVDVHLASLAEVLERFGSLGAGRIGIGLRLKRIYDVARSTGHVRGLSFLALSSQRKNIQMMLMSS